MTPRGSCSAFISDLVGDSGDPTLCPHHSCTITLPAQLIRPTLGLRHTQARRQYLLQPPNPIMEINASAPVIDTQLLSRLKQIQTCISFLRHVTVTQSAPSVIRHHLLQFLPTQTRIRPITPQRTQKMTNLTPRCGRTKGGYKERSGVGLA